MARHKSFKPEFNEKSVEFITRIHEELISRGSKKHNISDLIHSLLISAKASIIDDFVSENTPVEYKLKMLLASPKENSKVLEILNRKTFGLQKEEREQSAVLE